MKICIESSEIHLKISTKFFFHKNGNDKNGIHGVIRERRQTSEFA